MPVSRKFSPVRINRKIHSVMRIGIARSLRIRIDIIALSILQRIYGFQPWHTEAPLSARPYRRVVADIVSGLDPQCVVEVGCGLGSILALVEAPERFGYDLDMGVIKAARLLHGRNIVFVQGDMASVSQKEIDVLILVNWIHELSPEALESSISPLLPYTKLLLLDAIDPSGPEGYRFKHNFDFLNTKARRLSVTRSPGEGRSFCLFEVQNNRENEK